MTVPVDVVIESFKNIIDRLSYISEDLDGAKFIDIHQVHKIPDTFFVLDEARCKIATKLHIIPTKCLPINLLELSERFKGLTMEVRKDYRTFKNFLKGQTQTDIDGENIQYTFNKVLSEIDEIQEEVYVVINRLIRYVNIRQNAIMEVMNNIKDNSYCRKLHFMDQRQFFYLHNSYSLIDKLFNTLHDTVSCLCDGSSTDTL